MTVDEARARARRHSVRKAGDLSPQDEAILWDLEERFWTGGADSARTATATNAVMLFPYPPGISEDEQVRTHPRRETGWRTVEMKDRGATVQGTLAVLTYLVSAEKSGSPIYKALCASTYLRDDGGWLRMSHRRTAAT